jgi:hypothetical protein
MRIAPAYGVGVTNIILGRFDLVLERRIAGLSSATHGLAGERTADVIDHPD